MQKFELRVSDLVLHITKLVERVPLLHQSISIAHVSAQIGRNLSPVEAKQFAVGRIASVYGATAVM
jgi:hypothetical protein